MRWAGGVRDALPARMTGRPHGPSTGTTRAPARPEYPHNPSTRTTRAPARPRHGRPTRKRELEVFERGGGLEPCRLERLPLLDRLAQLRVELAKPRMVGGVRQHLLVQLPLELGVTRQ